MKNALFQLLKILGKRFIFWLLLFTVLRSIFLLYYRYLLDSESIPLNEILLTFVNAFWLDVSTASYLLLLPLFLYAFHLFKPNHYTTRIESIYMLLMIGVYSLISAAELGLYAEWKTKLSYKALAYLKNPDEVFNSASTSEFILLISIWLVQTALAFYLFKKLIIINKSLEKNRISIVIVSFLIYFFVIFTGIRGGWTAIPITTSAAYFSQHNILNMASVNPGYNMLMSTINSGSFNNQNLFHTMPDDKARQVVNDIHSLEKDSTIHVFKVEKPNIVVLLLESWSADLIESLGGEAGITPNFRQLEAEGLLFTNFYTSANRSQQAMGSLFAGIPGIPITTITNHPEKYAALPSLVQDLKKVDYYTSFYFGGELIYGNILSYLMYNEFDRIVEGKDLDATMPRGKLGVHDEYLLKHFAVALNSQKQPFFSTVFTLSSHSPYDFPMASNIQWPKLEKEFVNSAAYSDYSLGEFFALAKRQSWYENTIFIVMADHSHNTYRNHELQSFAYHKIPLLLFGPALVDSLHGKQFEKICGNTDVTATLLAQLGLSHKDYPWSKNLFNQYYDPFAYFELNEGFGWKRPEGEYVWNQSTNKAFVDSLPDDSRNKIIEEGKAYLQVWYSEFLGY